MSTPFDSSFRLCVGPWVCVDVLACPGGCVRVVPPVCGGLHVLVSPVCCVDRVPHKLPASLVHLVVPPAHQMVILWLINKKRTKNEESL